jgi:hypothetical protein
MTRLDRILLPTAIFACLSACSAETDDAELRSQIDVVADVPLVNPDPGGSDIKALLVDVTAAEVHHATEGWQTIFEGTASFDLLDMTSLPYNLSTTRLPEGHYDEFRLTVAGAQAIIIDVSYPVEIPSGDTSGLKFKTNFCVERGTIEHLNLEWTVDDYFHHSDERGYWLEPSIKIISPPTCTDDVE